MTSTIAFFMHAWQGDIQNAKLSVASVHKHFPDCNIYILLQQPCQLQSWWADQPYCKIVPLPIGITKFVATGEQWLRYSLHLLLAQSKEQFFISVDPDSRVQAGFIPPFGCEIAGKLFSDSYGLQCVYMCGAFFQRKALQTIANWLANNKLAEYTSNKQRFVHGLEPWSFGRDRAIGFIAHMCKLKLTNWDALYFDFEKCLPEQSNAGLITHPHCPKIG